MLRFHGFPPACEALSFVTLLDFIKRLGLAVAAWLALLSVINHLGHSWLDEIGAFRGPPKCIRVEFISHLRLCQALASPRLALFNESYELAFVSCRSKRQKTFMPDSAIYFLTGRALFSLTVLESLVSSLFVLNPPQSP